MEVKEICNGSSTGDTNTRFKQSYWYKNYGTTLNKTDWVNPEYYNLLFGENGKHFEKYYWLACRYVYLYDSAYNFGLQYVRAQDGSCTVGGNFLYVANRITGYD